MIVELLQRFPALPEMFIASMVCIVLLVDLFVPKTKKIITYGLTQATLVVAAILSLLQYGSPTVIIYDGTFILDNLAIILKLFIYLCSSIAFLYARSSLPKTSMPFGEYYVLGLLSILGMMVIVSGHNFITLFLGLELYSLPVYAMVALRRESGISSEAAIKYFVIGSLASAMLLYGFSMLYGATQSLDIAQVAAAIMHTSLQQNLVLVFALVFVIAGLVFKIGGVPFHMWVPDVYEGAPTKVVLFLGTAPKIAAIGLIFRLLVDSLSSMSVQWQEMFIVVAIASMALGNLAAIVQKNIKRMLAYSSIAHMGYMSLGILTATPQGYSAALFYMITYALMTLAAFGLVMIMDYSGYPADQIDDLRGLNSRNPWLALMMLLTMFSLAGVPPLVGFMAKVSVLEALIGVHMVWLAAVALLFAIIGAFYYIRVIKVMYFENPIDSTPLVYSKDMQLALSGNGLLLLVLGIVPGYLFHLCQTVFHTSFY